MYDICKLRKLRIEKNITKREMAKRMGISESYYSKVEAGQKRLFYDMAVKIALILETKPDKIFFMKD